MAVVEIILSQPLTRGKCYILTGTYAETNVPDSVTITIGNNQSTVSLGTVTDAGAFTFSFNYTATTTFFQSLFIDESGQINITDLAIKQDAACSQKFCSECFSLEQCTEPEYLNLQWANDDDGFGICYTKLPMTQTLTLKGGLRQPDYTYDEDYFTTSKGKNFPVYVDAVKQVEMWVERVPEYIHDALRLGIVHDSFTVNLVEYTKSDGGYSPDWETPQSFLAPVVVRLRERVQDTKNINCN